jgi:hypothetical protein
VAFPQVSIQPIEPDGLAPPTPERELTIAEATVIGSLLSADASTERNRIVASGLSPRTYETARRRVFEAGWVSERFVPDPLAWGLDCLRLDIVETGSTAVDPGWSEYFAASPGAIHLWQGRSLVFAARIERAMTRRGSGGPAEGTTVPKFHWSMAIDLHQPNLPAYFDFDGSWSQVLGRSGPRRYPRSLPCWVDASRGVLEPPPNRLRSLAAVLVRKPFLSRPERPGTGHLGSIARLGPGQRATNVGLVQRRCFLNLATVPGFQGWQIESLAFVHGYLKPSLAPETLFRQLLYESRFTPFLVAFDGREVLFGALGPPPPSGPLASRVAVSEILRDRLDSWQVVATPVSSLKTLVNHRYDRIL